MTKPAFLFATAAVAWGAAILVYLGGAPATALTALTGAFTVITAASVGVLLAPLALLLGVARATVRA